jgi:hypothetical protein
MGQVLEQVCAGRDADGLAALSHDHGVRAAAERREDLVERLDARFQERIFEWRPYPVDGEDVQGLGFRYVGVPSS